jgi:cytochrome P450
MKKKINRVSFDPTSSEFRKNPYEIFKDLQNHEGLSFHPHLNSYIASRYSDVSAIIKDKRFGKSFEERTNEKYGPKAFDESVFKSMRNWMLLQDPPNHTRVRDVFTKAFAAPKINRMRASISALVDENINVLKELRNFDLMKDFAHKLPVAVICEMLGIPSKHRSLFYISLHDNGRLLDPMIMDKGAIADANKRTLYSQYYFSRLISIRETRPQDDLITELITADELDQKLTNEEIISNIVLLFGAGHETTVNLIGNGILAIHQNTDQLELLRENPGLIASAVDEMLRYDSSVQLTVRVALEDVLDIASTPVKKGDVVICLLGAANRDPREFSNPEKFDITRNENKALSFGGGMHYCLGAQLAKIQTEIAILKLINSESNLKIEGIATPDWRPGLALRALNSLQASYI